MGREVPLEKGMATHSSVLVWRIPWSLTGDSPWSCKELDTTEQLTFTFQFMSPALIMRLGYAAPLNHSSVDDPRPNYP